MGIQHETQPVKFGMGKGQDLTAILCLGHQGDLMRAANNLRER